MRLRYWLVIIVGLIVTESAVAQTDKYLVLDKPGRVKRIRYYVGDKISIKLTDDPTLYTDVINSITDSAISMRGTRIPLRDITAVVRYSESGLLNQGIRVLPVAGLMYFLGDTFNPLFLGDQPRVSRSGVVVGSSLIASSLILRIFRKKTLRLNQNRRLKVLETMY